MIPPFYRLLLGKLLWISIIGFRRFSKFLKGICREQGKSKEERHDGTSLAATTSNPNFHDIGGTLKLFQSSFRFFKRFNRKPAHAFDIRFL